MAERMTKNLNGHYARSMTVIETLRGLGYTVEIVRDYTKEPREGGGGLKMGYWIRANVNGNRLHAIQKGL
jgi:hypothetical protein